MEQEDWNNAPEKQSVNSLLRNLIFISQAQKGKLHCKEIKPVNSQGDRKKIIQEDVLNRLSFSQFVF